MKIILGILFFCFTSTGLYSQKIFGTVYNEVGDLLPYSSVTIKNSSLGASANENAKFSFKLAPGNYTLICQRIGYAASEKNVELKPHENTEVTFILKLQKLTLNEVVIKSGGEDPAYEIIRNAIKKRNYYLNEVKGFSCNLYEKDMVKLLQLPDKIMGFTVPKEGRQQMNLDSSGQGIIYLSESMAKVDVQIPNKFKMNVISSRVSGSGGFGFTFPAFISFYNNNINVFSGQLNPRGFVSPIADGALNFYKYKFMGSFVEDGKLVNTIRVWPRRSYEPLFFGIINIMEDSWRIHSLDLTLTQKAQLELLDTLQIVQQHVPVNGTIWRVKNQLLHFRFKQFGIAASGNFVNVYSNYAINPPFDKKYFDKIVIKYDTAVNKRSRLYWDSVRPVPLEYEELKDYKVKDSIYDASKDSLQRKFSLDSLNKRQPKFTLLGGLMNGYRRTHFAIKNQYEWAIDPVIPKLEYNFAEGIALNITGRYSRNISKNKFKLTLLPFLRYGFSNTHFNAWASVELKRNRNLVPDFQISKSAFTFSGGKRVSEFYKQSAIDPLVNSISSLFWGSNYMKTYENYFANLHYQKTLESSLKYELNVLYENRLPLNNSTHFTLRKKDSAHITSNYPVELISTQFSQHQALIISAMVSFKPGQKFIQFPRYKMPLNSKHPTFSLAYAKGISNIFGSDVNFDKWRFSINDDMNFKLGGLLKYRVSVGGFINNKAVPVQDYQHFNGNIGVLAGEYVNSLQVAGYYSNSTITPFYSLAHIEHHFNGLLTNKIPLIKRWMWNLTAGGNGLLSKKNNYGELFVGLENILKIFRVDAVWAFRASYKPQLVLRIGMGGLLGGKVQRSQNKTAIEGGF
ncbi:MAG: carboxypeptidase-like regulatory domain-containing protein [Chitinophagaceae bacterium]|nr:carboxypeptidase-like regulatory domain-containing protein [Chitinophagaceae bacterium]